MTNHSGVRSTVFYALVFLAGFANLATEIIGPRLVASLFGSTTVIWAIIISVTLVGISVGYVLGGRTPPGRVLRVLPVALIVNAIWLTLVSWLIWRLPHQFAAVGYASIALVSIAAFFPPSVLFSMTSPLIISLISSYTPQDKIAREVGNLYAISTLGSVVGALAAAFILIPYLGLSASLKLFAIGSALFAIVFMQPRWRLAGASVLLALVFAPQPSYQLEESENMTLLEQREGYYQTIRVFTDHTTYVRMDLGPTFQTSMSLPDKEPIYHYAAEMVALAGEVRGKQILIIGGAGHTQARVLEKRGASVVEVEIDPHVIALSDRYFGEIEGEVLAADGRAYLERLQGRQYDLIILDAYDALASAPVQLTTREFFEACNRALIPGGRLIFNFIGVPSGPSANSFRAIAATMQTVFADVRASQIDGEDLTNLILIGAQTELADSDFPAAPTGGAILTDDLNPIEIYFEQARSGFYFR